MLASIKYPTVNLGPGVRWRSELVLSPRTCSCNRRIYGIQACDDRFDKIDGSAYGKEGIRTNVMAGVALRYVRSSLNFFTYLNVIVQVHRYRNGGQVSNDLKGQRGTLDLTDMRQRLAIPSYPIIHQGVSN
jgi:hypothetical protein